jgi:trimeric autotransporter adhesin
MSDDAVRSKAVFFLVFLLLLVLFSAVARAQPAFQVEDLNTSRSAGIGSEFTSYFLDGFAAALDGTIFFAASDGIHGVELWRTDGTEAGTSLVADLCPGSCASIPRSFTVAGDEMFFLADDGLHGMALWKSGVPDSDVQPAIAVNLP